MTAFTEAQGIFDTPLYQETPCRIKGVIAQSAPSNIMKCAKEPLAARISGELQAYQGSAGSEGGPGKPGAGGSGFLRKYISEAAKLPPVLLFHGIDDVQVSVEHSPGAVCAA